MAVKKGREGCYGRLVRAADIKKGLEDGRGLPQSHEGRSGHLVCTADITKGRKGCHGCLVSSADIKKDLEDSRGLLQSLEGRSGYLVRAADIKKGRGGLQGLQDCFEDTATFFPNLQCRCTAVRFRFF